MVKGKKTKSYKYLLDFKKRAGIERVEKHSVNSMYLTIGIEIKRSVNNNFLKQ
jgi:hypothetical protein